MNDPFINLNNDEVSNKMNLILEEVADYSVDIEADPTLPELGTKYLQRVLSQCRNYLNRVTFYLQAVMRLEKNMKSNLHLRELDFNMKFKKLLADDHSVRQQPSIEDRKAVATVMLSQESDDINDIKVKLLEVEETCKILKFKHSELLRTSSDIKMQRAIVRDDKMSILTGDPEGYSKPQIRQDRTIPNGLVAPVTSDNLDPTDLLEGVVSGGGSYPNPDVDPEIKKMMNAFLNSESQKSDHMCHTCGERVYETPSGFVCKNGHGGSNDLEPSKSMVKNHESKVVEDSDDQVMNQIDLSDLLS